MVKILIADDHVLVRDGLKRLIESEAGFTVLGEAGNSDEALKFLHRRRCDLIILDISMPGKNGMELLKELRELYPQLKILILTMHPEERFAIRALKAGADGYLTKMSAPNELLHAIRKISSGGKYISASLAESIAQTLGEKSSGAGHELLSDREFEVMRLLGAGQTVSEIAKTLNLSRSTVSTYRKRILEKLGLHSNAEIIHYAMQHGIVDS